MTRDECLSALVGLLEADQRVRGAWLAGSLGRGGGDEWSDLDLLVAVEPEESDDVISSFGSRVGAQIPLVLHQQRNLGGTTVINAVTADWVRFDVAVVPPSEVAGREASSLRVLLDRDSLHASASSDPEPSAPSGPRVAELTREFLRVLGLLPVVLGRGELVVGASGAALVRTLLVQLVLEEAAGADRGGALRLRGVLGDERLEQLRTLPPVEAERQSVIAVHVACAAVFLPLARELSSRTGQPWPGELEQALRRHLARELDLDLPG